VLIDGAFNFRDAGGARTTSGRPIASGWLYRSGNLDTVTPAGWVALHRLGVRRVVDLRLDRELTKPPLAAPGPATMTLRAPVWGGDDPGDGVLERLARTGGVTPSEALQAYADDKVSGYLRIIEHEPRAIGVAVEALAGAGTDAAVLHCAAGKDRTGIIIALLLLSLGVPQEQVGRDYVSSRSGISPARIARYCGELEALGVAEADFAPVYAAHPPALQAAVALVEQRWASATRTCWDRQRSLLTNSRRSTAGCSGRRAAAAVSPEGRGRRCPSSLARP